MAGVVTHVSAWLSDYLVSKRVVFHFRKTIEEVLADWSRRESTADIECLHDMALLSSFSHALFGKVDCLDVNKINSLLSGRKVIPKKRFRSGNEFLVALHPFV